MKLEHLFIKGAIYKSKSHGMVEFKGMDTYYGQTTFHFYSITYNQNCYWLPEALNERFGQETMELMDK